MLVQQEGTEHTRVQRGVFRLKCMRSYSPDSTAWVRKKKPEQGLKELDLPERSSATWY